MDEQDAPLQNTIKATICKGEKLYVGDCVEIAVVPQGNTLDETVKNLQEAAALHLEDEDLGGFGLTPNPTLEFMLS